jgi:hypothetical protein
VPRVLIVDTAGAKFSMSSTASLRIDPNGNSLPLPDKSTGWPENAATGLKYIPFWDNPMIGSVSAPMAHRARKLDKSVHSAGQTAFCVTRLVRPAAFTADRQAACNTV